MNLEAIREALGDKLVAIDGVRVYSSVPEAMASTAATAIVVAQGEPYVRYSRTAGLINRNEIRLRLVIIPAQQQGAERLMGELDALLSCGTAATRALRARIDGDMSLAGTACSVTMLEASVRTITVNDFVTVVGEVDVMIEARC